MKFNLLICMIGTLAAPGLASASFIEPVADVVDLNGMVIAGSGCSSDSVTAVVTDQGSDFAVDLTYSDLVAAVSESRSSDRKACVIRIPVHIPEGQRLTLESTSSDGYASITSGDQGAASYRVSLFGYDAPVDSRNFPGRRSYSDINEWFSLHSATQSAGCGGNNEGLLAINLAATVQGSRYWTGSSVAINQTSLQFRLTPCF